MKHNLLKRYIQEKAKQTKASKKDLFSLFIQLKKINDFVKTI